MPFSNSNSFSYQTLARIWPRTPREAFLSAIAIALIAATGFSIFACIFVPFDARNSLGQYDQWTWYGAQAFYLDTAIHSGSLPLWNPHLFCGTPFAASPQTSAFYLPQLIRAVTNVRPTPLRTHAGLLVMTLLHLIAAAGGAYALGRAHGLSRRAALFAALAFGYSAGMARHAVAHWTLPALTAWQPWICLCLFGVARAERLRTAAAFACAAGLALGMAFLIGFPQLWLVLVVSVSAYALALPLLLPGECRTASSKVGFQRRPSLVRKLGQSATGLIVAGFVSAGIGAAVMLPALEYSSWTARGKAIGSTALHDPNHVFSMSEMFTNAAVYAGPENKGSFYAAGAAVLIFAAAGLAARSPRTTAFWLLQLLVLLDISLTRIIGFRLPIGEALEWIAPFRFEVPERALLLAMLPLAMLAGRGIDLLGDANSATRRTAIGAALAFLAALPILGRLASWLTNDPYVHPSWLVVAAPGAALILFLFGALRPAPEKSRLSQHVLQALLALLLALEIGAWNATLSPFRIQQWPYEGALEPLSHSWSIDERNSRGVDAKPNAALYSMTKVVNGYDALYLERTYQILTAHRIDGDYHKELLPEDLYGSPYVNTFLKRPFWLVKQWSPGGLPDPPRAFPPTASVLLAARPSEAIAQAQRVPDGAVSSTCERIEIQLDPVPGRSGVLAQSNGALRIPSRHAALAIDWYAPEASSAEVVVLNPDTGKTMWREPVSVLAGTSTTETSLPDVELFGLRIEIQPGDSLEAVETYILSDLADENEHITITDWRPNRVYVHLNELPGPRILLFTDANYPGWRAYVNDAPTPIITANGGFKAIAVPAGAHNVQFVISLYLVWIGVTVSLCTAAAAGAMIVFGLRRKCEQRS